MQKPVDSFLEYIVSDVLSDCNQLTFRKMFGGYALYLNQVVFGIITGDSELYFKVDSTNRHFFESRQSHPFVYNARRGENTKSVTLSYWYVTEEIMEDRELVTELALQSAQISKKEQ